MSGLGEQLRAARETQRLTLVEVAERTHIRVAYLAALESGDFGALPARVYVEGMVRSYSAFLGLDPDATLRELRVALGPGGEAGVRPHLHSVAGPALGLLGASAAAVVLVALLAVLALGLVLWQGEAAPGGESAQQPGASRQVPVDRGGVGASVGEELLWLLRAGLRIEFGRE